MVAANTLLNVISIIRLRRPNDKLFDMVDSNFLCGWHSYFRGRAFCLGKDARPFPYEGEIGACCGITVVSLACRVALFAGGVLQANETEAKVLDLIRR
jgi:hypothetical protein